MALGDRFCGLIHKYGKVPLGVHLIVSAASITGLYVAIKNNVDVEPIFEKVGHDNPTVPTGAPPPGPSEQKKKMMRNRTAGFLCHRAMFPVRLSFLIALTPPVARFLAKRNILKNHL